QVLALRIKKLNQVAIEKVISSLTHPDGGTSIYKALTEVLEGMVLSRPCVIVALTDGDDNDQAQATNLCRVRKRLVQLKQHKSDVTLMMLTVGSLSNESTLRSICEEAPKSHFIKADASQQ